MPASSGEIAGKPAVKLPRPRLLFKPQGGTTLEDRRRSAGLQLFIAGDMRAFIYEESTIGEFCGESETEH